MNQNQRVPSWDLDYVTTIPKPPLPITSGSHSTTGHNNISMLDYEVTELTWENGQLTMHGLGLPRVSSKSNLVSTWTDKPYTRASGTLESVVNQTIKKPQQPLHLLGSACENDDLVPMFNPNTATASISVSMDALVPTANGAHKGDIGAGVGCSTPVGSCSTAARVPVGWDRSVSASGSTRRERLKRPPSKSIGMSPEDTKTVTLDDHDSVCHSRPQKVRGEEEDNGNKGIKRSRAAATHNQSERKRRDKINQRMKTLQKLVPNSNKTDKASMLDEVIDYLKQLQAQVQMMSRMSMPAPMMMPMAIQQQLQMSMMSQMGMGMGMSGMGMGMGMGMDHMNMSFNSMAARPGIAGISPTVLNPLPFMTSLGTTWDGTSTATAGDRLPSQQAMVFADPLSTYLACQSQPMTMDTYSKMAAIYQQLQQNQQPGQNSNTQG